MLRTVELVAHEVKSTPQETLRGLTQQRIHLSIETLEEGKRRPRVTGITVDRLGLPTHWKLQEARRWRLITRSYGVLHHRVLAAPKWARTPRSFGTRLRGEGPTSFEKSHGLRVTKDATTSPCTFLPNSDNCPPRIGHEQPLPATKPLRGGALQLAP